MGKKGFDTRDSGLEFQQLLLFIHPTGFDLVDASFDVIHLDCKERMLRIIEGEVGCGIEINEPGNLVGEATADRTKLLACYRMPDQHWTVYVKCLHHRQHVVAE